MVAGDRRCLADRREKGGAQTARTVRGRPGSRFHLAVDRNGVPLAIRLAAGNENERRHLLPLVDELLARGIKPVELLADRGYDSQRLRAELADRGIDALISKRRRPHDPLPAATVLGYVDRGRSRRAKTRDPLGRHRWPVERTNAWLHNCRRIATRWEKRPELYLAFLQLGCALIIYRLLESL